MIVFRVLDLQWSDISLNNHEQNLRLFKFFHFFSYSSIVVVSWIDFGCCLLRRMGFTLYFRNVKIDVTESRTPQCGCRCSWKGFIYSWIICVSYGYERTIYNLLCSVTPSTFNTQIYEFLSKTKLLLVCNALVRYA